MQCAAGPAVTVLVCMHHADSKGCLDPKRLKASAVHAQNLLPKKQEDKTAQVLH